MYDARNVAKWGRSGIPMTKARGRIYGRQRHDRYSGTLPSNVYMILRLPPLPRLELESGKESDNQGE